QQCNATQRRIAQLSTGVDLLIVKAFEVVPAGELNGRMMGCEALDKHLAFDIAPSGTAGDLRDQLESALAGAKIRNVQAQVRVDDSDERDIGKVQSFGDHLRADENVDLCEPEIAQNAPVIFFAF